MAIPPAPRPPGSRGASRQRETPAPRLTAAEQRLLSFAVWNVRTSDMPPDVKAAAAVVAASGRYPRPVNQVTYPDGDWRVSLIPDDENAPILDHHPVALGAYVENLLDEHGAGAYAVLVQHRR